MVAVLTAGVALLEVVLYLHAVSANLPMPSVLQHLSAAPAGSAHIPAHIPDASIANAVGPGSIDDIAATKAVNRTGENPLQNFFQNFTESFL